jgi:RNA-directed DNA polymerase
MPKDAPPNGDALAVDDNAGDVPVGPRRRVSEMQAKLHRWAVADPGRRFDDLFNLVHDPATLIVVGSCLVRRACTASIALASTTEIWSCANDGCIAADSTAALPSAAARHATHSPAATCRSPPLFALLARRFHRLLA